MRACLYLQSAAAVDAHTGFELPEEDRNDHVESELPNLPPDKDPQAQTLTRPQTKRKPQNKEMVTKAMHSSKVELLVCTISILFGGTKYTI